MEFRTAWKLMLRGHKVMRPHWGGYWEYDESRKTILMHCKDGKVLDIRETDNVAYTINNIAEEDWKVATDKNCCLLGGRPLFDINYAAKALADGARVRRTGWSDGTYIFQSSETGHIYRVKGDRTEPWTPFGIDLMSESYTYA